MSTGLHYSFVKIKEKLSGTGTEVCESRTDDKNKNTRKQKQYQNLKKAEVKSDI